MPHLQFADRDSEAGSLTLESTDELDAIQFAHESPNRTVDVAMRYAPLQSTKQPLDKWTLPLRKILAAFSDYLLAGTWQLASMPLALL